jgi:hypothetical protein
MAEEIEEIFERDDGTLGVGKKTHRLYWNGQPIITEEKIKLSKLVNISIIIGAISTALYAIVTLLAYLNVST